MPAIACFYGIAIRMHLDDHHPPHVHAFYGRHESCVAIATGNVLEGDLPANAARLVKQWILARKPQLVNNWARARSAMPLKEVAGLDAE